MPLAGNQIFDRFDPAGASPAGPISISPKWNQNSCGPSFKRHRDSHGIVARDQFLYVADDLGVIDLSETKIARLQQGWIRSANSIDLLRYSS